ncbi:hypothetical protein ACRAWG_34095 [Methylobacterium sp. P31]
MNGFNRLRVMLGKQSAQSLLSPTKRAPMRVGLILLAAFSAAVASLHFAYPVMATAGCPSCYNFTALGDGIYVQRTMPARDREAAGAAIEEARARMRAFYGSLEADPRLLLCRTDDCYRPPGGGQRGIARLREGS